MFWRWLKWMIKHQTQSSWEWVDTASFWFVNSSDSTRVLVVQKSQKTSKYPLRTFFLVGFRRVRVKKLRRDEKRCEVRKSWEKSFSKSSGSGFVSRVLRKVSFGFFEMSRPREDEMSRETIWFIVIQWDINGILMGLPSDFHGFYSDL